LSHNAWLFCRQKTTFLEPLTYKVGDNPCTAAGGNATAAAPQLTGLSCLAQQHQLAIAANVFTKDPASGDAHITEVVFDSAGVVAALCVNRELNCCRFEENTRGLVIVPACSRIAGVCVCGWVGG
jgi:hypothetical protein